MFLNFSHKYNKYGSSLNSQDLYKFAALVIMTIDHIGHFLFPDYGWLRAIGRITFPVWFFLAGYSKNLNIKKDIIVLAALMIVFKAVLIKTIFPLNALVTIILIRVIIKFFDKRKININDNSSVANVLIVCLFLSVPTLYFCEYGTQGLLYGFMGYMVRNTYEKKVVHYVFIISTAIIFLVIQTVIFKFNDLQNIFVWLGTGYCTWKLSGYKITEIKFFSKIQIVENIIKFFSRYSLYYYFIHIVILQLLVGKILSDERFLYFKWH